PDRIAYLLEDARVVAAITTLPLSASLPAQVPQWMLETIAPALQPGHDVAASAAAGDQLAYLIYTSGSTGKPKG
ncbi:AMP-binding protein, partial [Xanthomonas bonasiae]|uniref:AMP-binding protein n=1 Tax=Xanthomonas bonasiae TaxID=2810351 RepID=UPI00197CEB39